MPGPADPTEVAGRLRLSVTRLARILRQQDAASLGPTLSSALATVHHCGPLTLGDLAAREHVTPPSITRAVEKLEAQGLVVRRTDAQDRRLVLVEISAAGRRRIAESRSRHTAWLASRLRELSPADLESLAAAAGVLTRLTEVVSNDAAGR